MFKLQIYRLNNQVWLPLGNIMLFGGSLVDILDSYTLPRCKIMYYSSVLDFVLDST